MFTSFYILRSISYLQRPQKRYFLSQNKKRVQRLCGKCGTIHKKDEMSSIWPEMSPMQQNELLSSTVLWGKPIQMERPQATSNSSPDRGLRAETTTTVAKARRKEDDMLEVVLQEMVLDLL